MKISIVKACPKLSDGSNVIFVKDNDLTSYEQFVDPRDFKLILPILKAAPAPLPRCRV